MVKEWCQVILKKGSGNGGERACHIVKGLKLNDQGSHRLLLNMKSFHSEPERVLRQLMVIDVVLDSSTRAPGEKDFWAGACRDSTSHIHRQEGQPDLVGSCQIPVSSE